jgi:hypothetical protein
LNKIWINFISTVLLCVTLIICTLLYVKFERSPSLSGAALDQSDVMNISEASKYLRISTDNLKAIIKQDDTKRKTGGVSNAAELLPYAEFNGELIFYRPKLDKWVDYNTLE